MKILKLLVLLCCVIDIDGYRNQYCEICRNHTLCLYPVDGPSAECRGFDKRALLTYEDIKEILNRINYRRNSVATGQLDRFPQAANMRKIIWSKELATFAQRWADQCDPSIRPNREDICRDFANMQIGQSIATVSGPSPGLHVKSFIDMWFMMKLRYFGNIVYYNQSLDEKANHFTQLIWANTEYVGCGKVKFFNHKLNNTVDRLVCNFAPKGNNHGKPVYAVGYPATQCPHFMKPDREYTGLCSRNYQSEIRTSIPVESSSISNLLRILDLSNNSVKQDLDPNNLKQTNFNSGQINDQRKQKSRHVFFNISNGAIKRDSFHMQNPLNEPENFKIRPFTPERGHSRMYHGYQTQKKSTVSIPIESPSTFIAEENFRRYDLTSVPYTFTSQARRNFGPMAREQHCTRTFKANDDCCTTPCVINQCTRGGPQQYRLNLAPHSCNSCIQTPFSPIPLNHQESCPCNKQNKCSTVPQHCNCNAKCQCVNHNNCPSHEQTTCCAKRRAGGEEAKATQFNYYDLFPNIGMRSGDSPQLKHANNPEAEDNMDYNTRVSRISNQRKEKARLRGPDV